MYGTFEPVLRGYDDLYAFLRRGTEKQLLVLGNMSEKEVTVPVPALPGGKDTADAAGCVIVLNNMKDLKTIKNRITLAPWQGVILDVTK